MNKPISYFCSVKLGEEGIMEEIENQWGSNFEQLSDVEKYWLLASVARQLWIDFGDGSQVRDPIITGAERIGKETSLDERLALIQAIAENINL